MKTKEEILNFHLNKYFTSNMGARYEDTPHYVVYDAMDEYAQQFVTPKTKLQVSESYLNAVRAIDAIMDSWQKAGDTILQFKHDAQSKLLSEIELSER